MLLWYVDSDVKVFVNITIRNYSVYGLLYIIVDVSFDEVISGQCYNGCVIGYVVMVNCYIDQL